MENELFEKTKVSKAYMTLALPVVLGMVVSLIYNMVDTFFIARTGNTALIAGVSLGTPIFTLMIALGDIFGVGAAQSFRVSSTKRVRGRKKDQCILLLCGDCCRHCGQHHPACGQTADSWSSRLR